MIVDRVSNVVQSFVDSERPIFRAKDILAEMKLKEGTNVEPVRVDQVHKVLREEFNMTYHKIKPLLP